MLTTTRERFINNYPNTVNHVIDKDNEVRDYFIRSYFTQHPTKASGDIENFLNTLFNLASMTAPDVIKKFMKNDEPLAVNERNHSLYPLAVGIFNGVQYTIKATSMNKYHKHEYIIEEIQLN